MPPTHYNAGNAPQEAISARLRSNCVSMCLRLMPSEEKANPTTRAWSTYHYWLNFLKQVRDFLDKGSPALQNSPGTVNIQSGRIEFAFANI